MFEVLPIRVQRSMAVAINDCTKFRFNFATKLHGSYNLPFSLSEIIRRLLLIVSNWI